MPGRMRMAAGKGMIIATIIMVVDTPAGEHSRIISAEFIEAVPHVCSCG
jgi:hypothetical protein